jgi:hypothetical protein
MPTKISMTKIKPRTYIVNDEDGEEWDNGNKIGENFTGMFRKSRNLAFHRKYFALLKISFDAWEPDLSGMGTKYGKQIEKNFERFRKDIVILCGYYSTVVRLDGSVRVEADSISFSKMDEHAFKDLYSKTLDLLIKNVYGRENMTEERMEQLVNTYLGFV